jgi:glycosyltransferase involved in cell wall biosynthesis
VRTTVIFDNFGPYHLARLQAAALEVELLAVEVAASSAVYAWDNRPENGGRKAEGGPVWKIVTLLERGTTREIHRRELVRRMNQTLDDFHPEVVFIPGWSSKAAFAALRWCVWHDIPAVVMSESTKWDELRVWWKEWVKLRVVGLCSAAFVGGSPHADYMEQLGMPAERIFWGYDAVDNAYFSAKAEEVRSQRSEVRSRLGLPEHFFLASARFVEKKNLPRLIKAYALYRKKSEARSQKSDLGPLPSDPWSFVLLGDGPLKTDLCHLISDLSLQDSVLLPGFKQYSELPVYYALANAFVHTSTKEPWGLVVNEAMASGLLVLVSNRCGCVADLVQESVNGFTFDPYNVEQIAQLMLNISAFRPVSLSAFGDASRMIISVWGTERFATGLKAAVNKALEVGSIKPTTLQRTILELLLRR